MIPPSMRHLTEKPLRWKMFADTFTVSCPLPLWFHCSLLVRTPSAPHIATSKPTAASLGRSITAAGNTQGHDPVSRWWAHAGITLRVAKSKQNTSPRFQESMGPPSTKRGTAMSRTSRPATTQLARFGVLSARRFAGGDVLPEAVEHSTAWCAHGQAVGVTWGGPSNPTALQRFLPPVYIQWGPQKRVRYVFCEDCLWF